MIDEYGRAIDYIRISITDRCNLRCTYCMPEEGVETVPHAEILTYDEIGRLAEIFASLGIRKIKLTGGEPLLQEHMEELVSKCKEKNIYLIARIVAFKDPYLAEHRPDLAIRTKGGEVFHDKKGLAWVNPYNQEVWDYLVEIGTQAAEAGFDEILFDYIRFSTD